MAFAIFIAWIGDGIDWYRARKTRQPDTESLIPKNIQEPSEKPKKTNPIIMMIPCACDLIASTIMTFGLIYISTSIFQMLRGSMVIFSAILSRVFLDRKIRSFHFVGLCLACLALVMVGIAGMMIPQTNTSVTAYQTFMGCCLVVFSQLIQAGQMVIEEFLLKNVNLPALKIVGFEGIWGTLLMIIIACPLAYLVPGKDYSTMPHNSLENTWDSLLCLASSGEVIGVTSVFMFAVLMYNCYGMLITDTFNAVNRTIFEAVRTTCIWVTDLCIHAIWPHSPYGEVWDMKWSWLELAGFVVLISSSFTYNGIIKIPGLDYSEPRRKKAEDE